MNEKEAREIVVQLKNATHIFENIHPNAKAYFLSEGYLEAIEKARYLFEALDQWKYFAPENPQHERDIQQWELTRKKALVRWEKEK